MKTILVVDDSPVARTIVKRTLAIIGLEEAVILEANHGVEALAILGNEEVDLMITDVNMPEMDGISLLKRVKASPRLNGIPVVIASSSVNATEGVDLSKAGAVAVVHKPVTPPVLAEAIESMKEEVVS